MMRGTLIALILLAACNSQQPTRDTTDTRMPIANEYVRGNSVKIYATPADNAAVLTTYRHGESVSILSKRGAWSEVRVAAGRGWVKADQLADASEANKTEADNLKPHYERAPEPVSQPGAHGEIVLEADVNTDGVVTNVRTIRNTTGSTSLEIRNAAALRQAVFTPIVRHGRREAFVYEHRVHY
jgi:uncharacterized protein YgiM (DUF1202 family)